MTMKILGIDVASTKTGWGLVVGETILSHGLIKAPSSLSLEDRLLYLFNELALVYDKHDIDYVGIEDQFLGKNVKTIKALSQARGVAVVATRLREIPVLFIEPTAVKRIFTDSGKASKQDVQAEVRRRFNIEEIQEDEADAIAIAYALGKRLEEIE